MSQYEFSPENMENQPRPRDVDYDWWSKELSRIGGLNDYGGPNIRLAWGPEEERIAYGRRRKTFLAAVIKKMAYWMETRKDGTRIKHPASKQAPNCDVTSLLVPVYEEYDVAKSRWAFMEWWPPELVAFDWESNRYQWKGPERIDILGPVPKNGMYRPIMLIETDDHKYRPPIENDLETIRELLYLKEQEKKTFGNREVQKDPAVINKFVKEIIDYYDKKEEEVNLNTKERLKEAIAPRLDKLVKNPGVFYDKW